MFENQYLTFVDYTSLGGTLTEDAFNLLEYEARTKINKLTSNRLIALTSQDNAVKLCILKLISVVNENNTSVKSESVDGYSITLLDKKDLMKHENDIIRDYLGSSTLEDGTPYLWLGLDNDYE